MKTLRYLALLSTLLLLFPLCALAKDKNQHSLDISDSVQVGTTQLQPGTYKVEWQQAGPAVTIKFLHGSKVVATVPGTLKTNDKQVTQDGIVTEITSGNKRVLREIDFAHQKEALVLAQQGV
ncbi:MAG TPA: hypothetical protein VEI52_03735 [Terriglobales bacterium]|nr:hypothetical protein [Terriglobales bacterium]